MKRKDVQLIAMSIIFAAIFAFIVSLLLFNSKQSKISVPVVEAISPDFPDVNNDPSYKVIFNKNALDPTLVITIGGPANPVPFSGNQ